MRGWKLEAWREERHAIRHIGEVEVEGHRRHCVVVGGGVAARGRSFIVVSIIVVSLTVVVRP